MEPIRTHVKADPHWVGAVTSHAAGTACAALETRAEMAVDDRGLVHGSFVFGVMDLAAMVAVNHPHVVLGGTSMRLLAPVRVGDRVEAEAKGGGGDARKREVHVTARVDGREVAKGTFSCFVLERHVLDASRA